MAKDCLELPPEIAAKGYSAKYNEYNPIIMVTHNTTRVGIVRRDHLLTPATEVKYYPVFMGEQAEGFSTELEATLHLINLFEGGVQL